MSTKPTISLARWANTGGAFVTDAPSGLRDTGFVDATPFDADIVNAELKQLYLWCLYLNDGDVALHNVTAATLELTAGLTVDVDAVVAGAITIGGQLYSFTDFTFTANSGTDACTATAHPLHTGAGPVRVTNSGGGLPGGLTAGTDYYAINIDANTFKLATSQANAVNGVAVDVTTNGTGTQTLQHQAGTTRISDATVTRSLAVGYNATVGRTLAVTGAATVGGTLGVTGAATVGGTIGVTGTATIGGDEVLSGALTVGGQAYTFTNFTFTADSTTDTCTATAHPLHTGLGPIRVSNSGGGLPGGLAAATDYYAINTGANTFQLATSRANAITGTAIDITSNGTGTQTVNWQAGTTRVTDAEVTRNLTVDGNLGVSSAATFSGQLNIGAILAFSTTSGSSLGGATTNNYDTSTRTLFFMDTTGGASTITGFTGAAVGRIIIIYNQGPNNLVLSNESASSTSTNRFTSPTGADLTLASKQCAILAYNFGAFRWVAIATNF